MLHPLCHCGCLYYYMDEQLDRSTQSIDSCKEAQSALGSTMHSMTEQPIDTVRKVPKRQMNDNLETIPANVMEKQPMCRFLYECIGPAPKLNLVMERYLTSIPILEQDQETLSRLLYVRCLLDNKVKDQRWAEFPFPGLDVPRFIKVTDGKKITSTVRATELDNLLMDILMALSKHEDEKYRNLLLRLSQTKLSGDPFSSVMKFYQHRMEPIDWVSTTFSFAQDQPVQRGQDADVEYKNYYFPIQNEGLIFTIKKTICAFMNGNGGTIVLGVHEDQKRQKWWVEGIELQGQEPLQLFFSDIANHNIYPRPQKERKIDIDFSPVEKTRSYKQPKSLKTELYFVKIIIPKGDPQHFYHIYKEDRQNEFELRNPLFFQRNHHENIQIKSMVEVQKELYRRRNLPQPAKR